jgi:hypothetical protein
MLRYIAIFAFLFALPLAAFAQPGITSSIVSNLSCSGVDCQLCHLMELVQITMTFMVYLGTLFAGLVFAYAGFMLVLYKGGIAQRTQAKQIAWKVLWGFLIMLAAWLIVDTIMKTVLNAGFGPWNEITCVAQPAPLPAYVPPTSPLYTPAPPPASVPEGNCPTNCVPISASVQVKAYPQGCSAIPNPPGGTRCLIDSDFDAKLVAMVGSLAGKGIPAGNWRVTEAWPPTYRHANPCHNRGSCVDANFIGLPPGRPTAADIKDFIDSALSVGFKPVYEVKTMTQRLNIQKDLPPAYHQYLDDVQWITAPHFSLYCSSCL